MNQDIRIENESIVIPSYREGDTARSYPLELLDQLYALGEFDLKLLDALWFYTTTKTAKEWFWSGPEELVGKDLTGYVLHYYVGESGTDWDHTRQPIQSMSKEEYDYAAYGPEGNKVIPFGEGEVILLVKS